MVLTTIDQYVVNLVQITYNIYVFMIFLPAFATSQGSLIISPEINLNVSERDIKLGSVLRTCAVTVKKRKKHKLIKIIALLMYFLCCKNNLPRKKE